MAMEGMKCYFDLKKVWLRLYEMILWKYQSDLKLLKLKRFGYKKGLINLNIKKSLVIDLFL